MHDVQKRIACKSLFFLACVLLRDNILLILSFSLFFSSLSDPSISVCSRQVVTDGFSAEKATANTAEMRALQTGDVSYKEQSAATAARARVELDGVSAEKSVAAARVSKIARVINEQTIGQP